MHCESVTDVRLSQRVKEGIRILDLRGRLKSGGPESPLRSAINALAMDKCREYCAEPRGSNKD